MAEIGLAAKNIPADRIWDYANQPGAAGMVSRLSGQMREYLRERLPDYMVPSSYVELKRLPLTANGKLDRKALPAPDAAELPDDSEAPRTPLEEIISGIWADVLRAQAVGTQQDFFELGGHSLLATQVISRVREAFNVEVPLKAMFERPTVAGLAEAVEREKRAGRTAEAPPIVAVSRDRELPLSFAQQRLWFIHQLEPDSAAYNVPIAVRLKGDLNIPALRQSVNDILERHEVLRTKFATRDGRPIQVIEEAAEVDLPVWDVTDQQEGFESRKQER